MRSPPSRPGAVLAVGLVALSVAACEDSGAAGITWQGITGHSRYFQIAGTSHDPSAPNAPVQCTSCHTDPSTFTVVSCTGCHNDSLPGGTDILKDTSGIHTDPTTGPFTQVVNGVTVTYGLLTSKCLQCHANGLIPHLKFPIGPGTKHGSRLCTDCHLGASRTDTSTLGCVKCHAGATPPPPLTATFDSVHGAAHGIARPSDLPVSPLAAADSIWCLRCHDQAALMRTSAHSRDCATDRAKCPPAYSRSTPSPEPPSGPYGYPLDSRHGGRGCFSCHSDANTSPLPSGPGPRPASVPQAFPQQAGTGAGTQPIIGNGPWAQSWSVPICYGCH
jgi:hypothetical protein